MTDDDQTDSFIDDDESTEEEAKTLRKQRENDKKEHALNWAFRHAAGAGDTDTVEKLLEAGLVEHPTATFAGIERAAENGCADTLKFLLARYDNLLVAKKALGKAVENEQMAAARIILDWIDQKEAAPPPSGQPKGPGPGA